MCSGEIVTYSFFLSSFLIFFSPSFQSLDLTCLREAARRIFSTSRYICKTSARVLRAFCASSCSSSSLRRVLQPSFLNQLSHIIRALASVNLDPASDAARKPEKYPNSRLGASNAGLRWRAFSARCHPG